jgi:hypothetical protein
MAVTAEEEQHQSQVSATGTPFKNIVWGRCKPTKPTWSGILKP